MRILWLANIIFITAACLLSCTSQKQIYAPVSTAALIDPLPKNGIRFATRGEAPIPLKKARNSSPPIILSKKVSKPPRSNREPNIAVSYWQWPARGPLLGTFSELNKGINIGGRLGDPVRATAAGHVIYSGNGIRGYGNLIIIKHNDAFLTAYAHNKVLLIKEGSVVKRGQKIAEMGRTGTQQTMLHFEIRRHGQPVNPLNYLRRNDLARSG